MPTPFSPSAGIVFVDRPRVLEEARAIAGRLRAQHPEVERVILFGSFARGRGGPRSDLDLVVVVSAAAVPRRERAAHYAPSASRPVDLVVYTRDELERWRDAPPPVLREALRHGVEL